MPHLFSLMNTCLSAAASLPFSVTLLRLKVAKGGMARELAQVDRQICLKGKRLGHVS